LSDGKHQLIQGDTKTASCQLIDLNLVVTASDVLDESMTGGKDASRAVSLETTHRSKPQFQSARVGLQRVVRILLRDMRSARDGLVEDPRGTVALSDQRTTPQEIFLFVGCGRAEMDWLRP
jgi:hypothetical protein